MDTKIEGSYQVTVTDYLGCSESIVFEVETPTIGSPDFDYSSFYLTNFNVLAVNDPISFNNLSSEQYFIHSGILEMVIHLMKLIQLTLILDVVYMMLH